MTRTHPAAGQGAPPCSRTALKGTSLYSVPLPPDPQQHCIQRMYTPQCLRPPRHTGNASLLFFTVRVSKVALSRPPASNPCCAVAQ